MSCFASLGVPSFDPKFEIMSIIYVLLSISLLVALVFFVIFIINVRKGQYDDTYTPSVRMLFEDELVKEKENEHPPTTPENKADL